jgi:hypothetical protein
MSQRGAEQLLNQASAVLSEEVGSHKPYLIRSASWLTRSALEELVTDVLVSRHFEPGTGSMRSRLTCLQVADPDLAETAEFAWSSLSRACHHHAFELSPTTSEVQHLVTVVRDLADRIGLASAKN